MKCVRCGRTEDLEEHHIIEKNKGGSDDPENKEWRCQPCHKYEHARRKILATIERESKGGQIERIRALEHRLEVLERLNTIELIQERGAYLSYWEDETTHFYPPYKTRAQRKKEQVIMELGE